MKILEYYCKDSAESGWTFSKVKFGNINLLVGNTATGKSRLLNTIFNLGRFVAANEFKNGSWDILFEHNGIKYRWILESQIKEEDREIITKEEMYKYEIHKEDETYNKEKILVRRDQDNFLYLDDKMPKLSLKETSASLLKEEKDFQPIIEAFSIIKRRLFHNDALKKVLDLQAIPMHIITKLDKINKAPNTTNSAKRKEGLKEINNADLNINAILFLLHNFFRDVFNCIVRNYKQIFLFIEDTRIAKLEDIEPKFSIIGKIPVFQIREKGSKKWVSIHEISSGMQKVLLILTDLLIAPDESIYIIDEYENSLGINAIDFFPQFILTLEKDIQFFITSHHPYIINEIPVNNWYVFHRNNMNVTIKHGEELEQKFGKSRQQTFMQLINDPFFSQGVE
jgi:predicted ATPase